MSARHLDRSYGYSCPAFAARERSISKLEAAAKLDGKRGREAKRKLEELEPLRETDVLTEVSCEKCGAFIKGRPMVWNALRALELQRGVDPNPPRWGCK